MLYAYDSATPPNRKSIKAAGGAAGARYIKRNLPNSYDLGSTERLGWLADGLGLLYNAEQSANDVLVQSTSWWRDYGKYTSDRLQAFGVPTNKGINVAASADCQVLDANLSKAISNLAAFAAGVEPFGTIGYGQISVLNLLTVEGISPKGAKQWLTASIGWSMRPSGPKASFTSADWDAYMAWPYAGMVQMLGSNVAGTDMNYLLDPTAMGFEWPENSPYAPKEDDMPNFPLPVIIAQASNPIVQLLRWADGRIEKDEGGLTISNFVAAGSVTVLVDDPYFADCLAIATNGPTLASAVTVDYGQLAAQVIAAGGVTTGVTADQVDQQIESHLARLAVTETPEATS